MTVAQLSATKAANAALAQKYVRRPKVGSLVDKHVAVRLKAARLAAGITLEKAATHINVTFQQVQKYENAANRISAGKLAILAAFYGKPLAWFFEGAPTISNGAE